MPLARIASVLRWVLVAVILLLLTVPALVPLFGGARFVVVDGGSMRPTYDYGDVLLISEPTASDFHPGHVVTVRRSDGTLYTHRIKTIEHGQALLQGDGNSAPDPTLISSKEVVGAVRAHFTPPLSEAILIAQSWPGRISLTLILIAGVVLPLDGRQRRATDTETEHDDEEDEDDVEVADEDDDPRRGRHAFLEGW